MTSGRVGDFLHRQFPPACSAGGKFLCPLSQFQYHSIEIVATNADKLLGKPHGKMELFPPDFSAAWAILLILENGILTQSPDS
jgi:hypothetical protein